MGPCLPTGCVAQAPTDGDNVEASRDQCRGVTMSERVKRHLGNLPALDGIPPAVSNAIGAGPVSFYVTEYRHICWQGSGPKGQPKFKLLTAVFTNSLHGKGGETQSSASSG